MYALVFPGQGSQSIAMLSELSQQYASVKACFDEASSGAGLDLWDLCQNGPEELLNKTENTQPALLAAGVAVWQIWQQKSLIKPAFLAGHSLGEYSALVAAGSLSLKDGAALVTARGRFMQEAVPEGTGGMAAILGLDDDAVIEVCSQIDGLVSAANFNSPGQVVIAGSAEAVNLAIEAATTAGARRAVPLAVSVPSHCELMRPAAEKLSELISQVAFETPQIPVIQNADAKVLTSADEIKDGLVRQLYQPVRWSQSIAYAIDAGVHQIGEAGPGKVLTGLMRRIDRKVEAKALENEQNLLAAVEAWAHEE